jgi:poly-gamma-glutamate synthesis protein (capsule biosynthesis protein)
MGAFHSHLKHTQTKSIEKLRELRVSAVKDVPEDAARVSTVSISGKQGEGPSEQLRASGVLLAVGLILLLALPGEARPVCRTLALVGDVMLGRGVAADLGGDWATAFASVVPFLRDADLAFGNLESPLTTAPQMAAGYDLRAPPEAVIALGEAGFDVVSLANNHARDAGEVGLLETEAALAAAGVTGVRVGAVDCAAGICILALDDSKAAVDVDLAADQVSAAAEGDLMVVSIHWGGEYQAQPSPRQERLARALVGAGADLIVGHGPHVLQRIEWVDGTPVAYSLGNFLFDQAYPADCHQGAILQVTACGSRVCEIEVVPTVAEDGRVRPAGPEEAEAILQRLHHQEPVTKTGQFEP